MRFHLEDNDEVHAEYHPALGIIDCYLFNGTPVDNPPSVPQNITVTPASNQIKFEWTKNTEEDIVGYMIYRDDNIISTIKNPTSSYIDKNVVLGKSYTYNIISYDVGGNSSIKSSDIVTRPEIVPGAPLKVSNFKINSSKNLTRSRLTLSFDLWVCCFRTIKLCLLMYPNQLFSSNQTREEEEVHLCLPSCILSNHLNSLYLRKQRGVRLLLLLLPLQKKQMQIREL